MKRKRFMMSCKWEFSMESECDKLGYQLRISLLPQLKRVDEFQETLKQPTKLAREERSFLSRSGFFDK